MFRKTVLTLIAAFAALALPAMAAVSGYMKLGDIKGEAVAKGHENWIEISSVEEGAEKAASSAVGSARANNRVTILPVVVTKDVDSTTPQIRGALVAGTVLKEVIIEYGDLKLEMTDVRITSVSSSSGDTSQEERLVLTPGQISWSTAGPKGVGGIEASFDVRTGTP
jgi:type VI protein secretion system component Hcp